MAKLNINSTVKLPSGFDIPVLGYGVYQTPESECEGVVKYALEVGYRHVSCNPFAPPEYHGCGGTIEIKFGSPCNIDSATVYGNEAACARAIAASGLPRSSIFFTSKVYANKLSYGEATAQINNTLKITGLDYVDLMLIHAPFGGPEGRKGAWKAFVDAQEAGKVRSIGVSNYGVAHLDELEAYIKELESERGPGKGGVISVGQWELQPWLAHHDIVSWCKQRGIVVQAYSPLTRGKRFTDPLLEPIVERTGKTAAQVLLRWSLQMGFVPLPKSVTLQRIKENTEIFDFELTPEEVKLLDTGKYEPSAWDPTVTPLSK